MFKKVALSFLLLYSLFGFFVLPLIVKSQLVGIVEKKTSSKLFINDVYFNPFIFNLEISGIELKDCNNEHLVSFKLLGIDLELYSLLRAAIHVNSITVDEPMITVVYNSDKTFNFSSLLKEQPSKEDDVQPKDEESAIPRIIVDSIKVNEGGVDYEDYTNSKKFDFSLESIGFELRDIDTNDFNSSDASIRFYSNLDDGGFVDFRSEIVGFKPMKLKGSIKFEASKLYTQWRYIQDMIGLEVANGKLSFGADYHLNVDDLNSTAIENLHVSLENLRVKPKREDFDVLNMKAFHVGGVTLKPMQQDVHVQYITMNSLDAKVKRDEKGEIDWIGYLKDPRGDSKEEAHTTEDKEIDANATPWSVVLDRAAFEKISVTVDDTSVKPNVSTKLNELNINLKDVTLAGEKPFLYDMNLLLNDKFKCISNGDVTHKDLKVNTYLTCQDFDIVHYKPYIDQIASENLKLYNISLQNAVAGFDVNASIKDENSTINAVVDEANFRLDSVVINKKDTNEKIVEFKSFNINGVSADTKTKDVGISKISLNGFGLYAKKDEEGVINLNELIEAKESKEGETPKSETKTQKEEKPYRLRLKHFNINSAAVAFNDESLQNKTTSKLDKINLNAYDIDSKEKSWLKYDLSLRVNEKGSVLSKGKVRHTPLRQEGNLAIKKVSLKEFTPYVQESAYLTINDGYLNLDSKLNYSKNEKDADLDVTGKLNIEEFFLHDSRDDSTIASFNLAELKSFEFKMFPNSLYVEEAALESFYLNALIDENKTMNLAKLAKEKSKEETVEVQDVNKSDSSKEESFALKVVKFSVSDGAANFADYSLPVLFKTSIHDLNGNIYAISNKKGEVSYVDIDGEVDKYGSTKIKGSVETSNVKSYTDIALNFKNLGLDSFSGYSAQFAGYKIDKGKLFLDLGYKIYDSQLLGENSLIIKKIELGDEVEDENITKLPLGFAIALLEDSEGVIDINMPVEGDMDSPDFKYGALVVKTLANLIVKAVASPFNFLGAAMGLDGDELKYVEFEASKFVILPSEKEKLDNIASILIKKPKLYLGVTATYNKELDKEAIQAEKLQFEIIKMSGNKGAVTLDVLEDIYEKAAGDKALDALEEEFEKRYKKDEVFKIEYRKELLARCRDIQPVSVDELRSLALKRVRMIQEYLVQTKNIDNSKVILHDIKEVDGSEGIQTALEIEIK